jgi:hypothetical protein
MRATRDRQILVWTMAALGLGSLLAGFAMQTEPLRALCGCGTMAQAGSREDCVRDRMAEALERAERSAIGRAAQVRRPETADAITRPAENLPVPARQHSAEPPVPPPIPNRAPPSRPSPEARPSPSRPSRITPAADS